MLEYDQAIPLNERERAKAEVIAVEAYLSLIQEIRRVKRQIGKIIKRPPDYCLIDKQGKLICGTALKNCIRE